MLLKCSSAQGLSLLRICGLFLLIISFNVLAQGQNLVPDPGFEIWDSTHVVANPNTLDGLTYWYNAAGTADHHHVAIVGGSNLTALEPCPTGEGNTGCGYPYEGGGVLGFFKSIGSTSYREWGGSPLLAPLAPGTCYEVSFWIQNKLDDPDFLHESNHWGIFFAHEQMPSFDPWELDFNLVSNQWVACDPIISGSEWQQVQLAFTPDEDYEYIYIGFMGNDEDASFILPQVNPQGFYVWVDQVVIEPIYLEVPEDRTICLGDSTWLHFTANRDIFWTDGQQSDTTTAFWVQPEMTTTYYVEIADALTCKLMDSVTVTVQEEYVMDYPGPICSQAEPLILKDDAGPGMWIGPGIVDAEQGLFDPSISGVGDFAIQFISNTDCLADFTMNVAVINLPQPSIMADPLQGCAPLTIELIDGGAISGVQYTWKFQGETLETETGQVRYTFADPGTYDIGVEVSYMGNCVADLYWENLIQVEEVPVANFSFFPDQPDVLHNEVQFTDLSSGNILQWHWDFGDQLESFLINPVHEYLNAGGYRVQLEVLGEGNCMDTISRNIEIENAVQLYVPNVFSPNLDGVNDHFAVYFAGEMYQYELTIFNRWGGMVFQSSDPGEFWDGSTHGGMAGLGVYTYLLKYALSPESGRQKVLSGDLLLIR